MDFTLQVLFAKNYDTVQMCTGQAGLYSPWIFLFNHPGYCIQEFMKLKGLVHYS